MMDMDDIPLDQVKLDQNILRALNRNGIFTIVELMRAESNGELEQYHQIGAKRVREIKIFLNEFNKIPTSAYLQPSSTPISDLPRNIAGTYGSHPIIFEGFQFKNGSDFNNILISRLKLPIRIERTLRRNGIETLETLISQDAKGQVHILKTIGGRSIDEIRKAVRNWINNPMAGTNQVYFAEASKNNWAEIIEPFFRIIGDRNIAVLLCRFGHTTRTLEETASVLHITRERVRQIQDRIARLFINHVENTNSEITEKIIFSISKQGDSFSQEKFKKELQYNEILGKFTKPIHCSFLGDVDLFETLICWLVIASNRRYAGTKLVLDIDIESLRNATVVSIKASKILDSIPPKAKRKIMRRLIYTGGIRVKDAQKLLSVSEEITLLVLENLDLKEVKDKWFSLKSADIRNKKIPVRSAGLKMLAAIDEMNFDDFYDGIYRYAKRFYETIAPPDVVAHMLQVLGFNIEDHKITTLQATTNILARSEKCFINAVNKNGNVVSFYEVADEFNSQGLSLPSVAVVLNRSPIAERLDMGLYKIRGRVISWDNVDAAQKRQKRISQDDEISYGLDGILRLKITVNRYAFLTGVIVSNKIKGLSGKWPVLYENQPSGNTTIDEMYLWGLAYAFNRMNVQVGDRVELGFNAWNRNLSLRKV